MAPKPKWQAEFVALWNAAGSLNEFIDVYPQPIARKSASVMASTLRKQGYELKRFKPYSRSTAKIEALRKLKEMGATYQLLGDALGVSKQAVHKMLQEQEEK